VGSAPAPVRSAGSSWACAPGNAALAWTSIASPGRPAKAVSATSEWARRASQRPDGAPFAQEKHPHTCRQLVNARGDGGRDCRGAARAHRDSRDASGKRPPAHGAELCAHGEAPCVVILVARACGEAPRRRFLVPRAREEDA
jgi:hypothetical protein